MPTDYDGDLLDLASEIALRKQRSDLPASILRTLYIHRAGQTVGIESSLELLDAASALIAEDR